MVEEADYIVLSVSHWTLKCYIISCRVVPYLLIMLMVFTTASASVAQSQTLILSRLNSRRFYFLL